MKYKLGNCKDVTVDGIAHRVYQIISEDFLKLEDDKRLFVSKGTRGGWVEDESCLSQEGTCWIRQESIVLKGARIMDSAHIGYRCLIYGDVEIDGNARVWNESTIDGKNYGIKITGNAEVQNVTITAGKNFGMGKFSIRIEKNAIVYGATIKGSGIVTDCASIRCSCSDSVVVSPLKDGYSYFYLGGQASVREAYRSNAWGESVPTGGKIYIDYEKVRITEKAEILTDTSSFPVKITGCLNICGNVVISNADVNIPRHPTGFSVSLNGNTTIGYRGVVRCLRDVLTIDTPGEYGYPVSFYPNDTGELSVAWPHWTMTVSEFKRCICKGDYRPEGVDDELVKIFSTLLEFAEKIIKK